MIFVKWRSIVSGDFRYVVRVTSIGASSVQWDFAGIPISQHLHPASTKHVSEQPSPDSTLPSSHVSSNPDSFWSSPQFSLQTPSLSRVYPGTSGQKWHSPYRVRPSLVGHFTQEVYLSELTHSLQVKWQFSQLGLLSPD